MKLSFIDFFHFLDHFFLQRGRFVLLFATFLSVAVGVAFANAEKDLQHSPHFPQGTETRLAQPQSGIVMPEFLSNSSFQNFETDNFQSWSDDRLKKEMYTATTTNQPLELHYFNAWLRLNSSKHIKMGSSASNLPVYLSTRRFAIFNLWNLAFSPLFVKEYGYFYIETDYLPLTIQSDFILHTQNKISQVKDSLTVGFRVEM